MLLRLGSPISSCCVHMWLRASNLQQRDIALRIMLYICVEIVRTKVMFQIVEIFIATSFTWSIIDPPRPAALRVHITNCPLSII